jgi:16S rRNA (cytosine1402-N4)-methyltransferase
MQHKSVLLHEVIDGLEIKNGDVFVDGTLGGGGHSEEIFRKFGKKVTVVGIDLDEEALARSKERLGKLGFEIKSAQGSFRDIDAVLQSLGFEKADKILLDLGLSSNQFEESGRGFSFQKNEPLLMNFKKNLTENDLTAGEILNTWDEENISAVLRGYGEERFAERIAGAIVRTRKLKPIETTFELVDIILSATPKFYHHRKIHPATKTFQALRIAVNDEIGALKDGLRKGFELLNSSGRLAVISFHSLEDRQVKQFFKKMDNDKVGKIINKKIIVPTAEEVAENPRARSAKLRILEKI